MHPLRRLIVKSAQLISEKVDKANGFEGGFQWCCDQLREAGYSKLANEVRRGGLRVLGLVLGRGLAMCTAG